MPLVQLRAHPQDAADLARDGGRARLIRQPESIKDGSRPAPGSVFYACNYLHPCGQTCLWIGSTQRTSSGFSTGSMSRLTTTASLSLRTNTHSRVSSVDALISWCGT